MQKTNINYDKYVTKKNNIVKKLSSDEINDKIILCLENEGFDITNEKIIYLIQMTKRALFIYEMYGSNAYDEMTNNNPLYLYNIFGNDARMNSMKRINILLRENNNHYELNALIKKIADDVYFTNEENEKEYTYVLN